MKEIALTQGKVTLVDDEDYEWLNQWNWTFSSHYACRWIGGRKDKKKIYMHRLITGAGPEDTVDHKDRDGLNNTKDNLRKGTHAQNIANSVWSFPVRNKTSRFKGVGFNSRLGKWDARISHKHLGLFEEEIEAARAYNNAAIEKWGEFCVLNDLGE